MRANSHTHALELMLTMPTPTEAHRTLECLKTLANDVRLEIVSILAQRECCVCELEVLLGLGQSEDAYHLAALKDAGLVWSEQRGKNP